MPKLFPLQYNTFISFLLLLKGICICCMYIKYPQIGVTGTANFFHSMKLICATLRETLTIFHIYELLLTVLIRQRYFQLIMFQNKEILTEVLGGIFFMLSYHENYALSEEQIFKVTQGISLKLTSRGLCSAGCSFFFFNYRALSFSCLFLSFFFSYCFKKCSDKI